MNSKHVLVAVCTMLLTGFVNAGTPAGKCRAALERESRNPDPTPAERELDIASARKAFAACRDASIPADLRARSARGWAMIVSQSDTAAAEAIYRESIRDIEKTDGPDAGALLPVLNGLMDLLVHVSGGPTGEAFRLANDIRRIAEKTDGAESEAVAEALLSLGRLHELNGNAATAEMLYRDAVKTAAAACAPRCGTLTAAYTMLRDLIKTDPARQAEADDLENRARESIPDPSGR